MFKRVDNCLGLTLWGWGKLHVELWMCRGPVREHSHPGQRVEVLPLWGWGEFWRVDWGKGTPERVGIGPGTWGRWLTIPAGWVHGFALARSGAGRAMPLVFVNATFDGRSAAENFEEVAR